MNKIGLRAKILWLMALPITGLLCFAIYYFVDRISIIDDAHEFKELVILGSQSSAVVHEIQKERGATAGFLGSDGLNFEVILQTQRLETDRRIAEMEEFVSRVDQAIIGNTVIEQFEKIREILKDLDRTRRRVDALDITLEDAIEYYTNINAYYLDNIGNIDYPIFRHTALTAIFALANFLQSKERAGIERAVLSNIFSHGSFKGRKALHQRLLDLITTQEAYIHTFLSLATKHQREFYVEEISDPAVTRAEAIRKIAETGVDLDALNIDPIMWFEAQTKKIDILRKIELYLIKHVIEEMENVSDEAQRDFAVLILIVTASVILSIVIGIFLSRIIREVVVLLENDVQTIARAEEKFRKAEAFKSMILSSTSEGVITIDDQGRVVELNDAMVDIFGYAKDEAIGKLIADLIIPPRLRDEHTAGVTEYLKTGEGPTLGARRDRPAIHKDGTEITVEMTVNPMKFDGRQFFTSFLRDITDTLEAKKELSRFKTTLDATLDCVFMFDPESLKFFYVNRGSVRQVGYTHDELMNMTPLDIEPEFDENHFRKMIAPMLDDKEESITFETMHRTKAGKDVPVEVFLQHIAPEGEAARMVAFVRDITSRKQAEQENYKLATAVEQVAESIVITDSDGVIDYVNPAFERISGFSRAEVIGGNLRMLKSGKQAPEFYKDLWATIASGEVWTGEIINKKKDGSLYEETMVISPIRDSSGRISNFIAVKRDLTEERKIERQTRQSRKMEALGVLAGGIAHDFNNILTPILGYSQIMKHSISEDSELHEDLDAVILAAERATGLVSQILQFSRQSESKPQPIHLEQIVQEVSKLLRSVLPKTVNIEFNFVPSDSMIDADATQVHTLLMNLAVNASQALPDGGSIVFSVQEVDLDKFESSEGEIINGRFLRVEVSDNGIGIDKDTMDRIFEPFFTTKGVGEGTGLGLSTVLGIVQQHKGYISVASTPNIGTKFSVYFPKMDEAGLVESKAECLDDLVGHESVLFVDDEQDIVEFATKGLEKLGYEIISATDPEQALDYFRSNHETIDIVITDRTMPNLTGEKLSIEIHRINKNTPIIICTGNGIGLGLEQLKSMKVEEVLEKPFNHIELALAIRRALRNRSIGEKENLI